MSLPQEGLTTLLYWGMLEAGISLVATNLPSLHFLVTKKSLRSFAASIRSAVSLNSLQSHQSRNRPEKRSPYSKMQTNGSTASDIPVVGMERRDGKDSGGVNAFAMDDLEHAAEVTTPQVVHITSEMRQEIEMV